VWGGGVRRLRTLTTGRGLAGYMTTRSDQEIAFAAYLDNFAVDGEDPAATGEAL
jgi:D-alanyl-D-alanine carboxypeptidase